MTSEGEEPKKTASSLLETRDDVGGTYRQTVDDFRGRGTKEDSLHLTGDKRWCRWYLQTDCRWLQRERIQRREPPAYWRRRSLRLPLFPPHTWSSASVSCAHLSYKTIVTQGWQMTLTMSSTNAVPLIKIVVVIYISLINMISLIYIISRIYTILAINNNNNNNII